MAAKNTKNPLSVRNPACACRHTGDRRIQTRFFATFCGQNSVGSFCLLLVLLLTLSPLRARQPANPQISEPIAAGFGQLRTLVEAKSYSPALALIDLLLGTVPADSYDRVLLNQIKSKILLTQGAYAAAIAPLEEVLRLADRPGYVADTAHTDTLFLLAQLHQQQSVETKADVPARHASLDRALGYLRRWQARIQKPTTEGRLFAATLLYQQATLEPDHVNTDTLDQARRAARDGLALQLQPPVSLYVLLLAIHQQLNEHAEAAELLELLVARHPDNPGYWQQLVSTYLALAAASAPDERLAARHNLRALLALERAQARGHLATPRDRFNLVALHLGLRQFTPAITLLENGLADRTLDNTRRNWELLANARHQAGQPDAALATLEKAVAALPADAPLRFALAQACYAAGRLADTRRHLENALKKDGLENPGQARLFLAYTCYELKDYPAAATAAQAAATHPDVKKDDLARLVQAIAEASKS
jgi:predicted Zn-dependent protease